MGTEHTKTTPAPSTDHTSGTKPVPSDSKQSQQASEKPVQMGDGTAASANNPGAGDRK